MKKKPKRHGEWYKLAIPAMMRIMLLYHYGDKEQAIKADGSGCPFYIFNPRKCFLIVKPVELNNAILEEPLRRNHTHAEIVDNIQEKKKKVIGIFI